MSILSGKITAEQLTKFILYSEWLIYSTWWVGDNLSSLMQSVGASEKVFQLMDLLPSDQFISKGEQFIQLITWFYSCKDEANLYSLFFTISLYISFPFDINAIIWQDQSYKGWLDILISLMYLFTILQGQQYVSYPLYLKSHQLSFNFDTPLSHLAILFLDAWMEYEWL